MSNSTREKAPAPSSKAKPVKITGALLMVFGVIAAVAGGTTWSGFVMLAGFVAFVVGRFME